MNRNSVRVEQSWSVVSPRIDEKLTNLQTAIDVRARGSLFCSYCIVVHSSIANANATRRPLPVHSICLRCELELLKVEEGVMIE